MKIVEGVGGNGVSATCLGASAAQRPRALKSKIAKNKKIIADTLQPFILS